MYIILRGNGSTKLWEETTYIRSNICGNDFSLRCSSVGSHDERAHACGCVGALGKRGGTAVLFSRTATPLVQTNTPNTFATQRHRKEPPHSMSAHLHNILHPGLFSEQRHGELFRSEHLQHPPHDVIVVRQAHVRLEGGVAEIGLRCHLGKARKSTYGEQARARGETKGGG